MCFLLIKHNHFSGENALQLVRPLISGCWGSAVFGKGIGVSKSPNCESLTVRSIWLVCFLSCCGQVWYSGVEKGMCFG